MAKKRYLDVDVVIAKIKADNPDIKMNREILAKELGVHKQHFVTWKGKHSNSKLYMHIDKLSELSGLTFEEMIKTTYVHEE